jgi:hypothetical protein
MIRMMIRMMIRFLVILFSWVLLFGNLIGPDLGVAFASGEACTSLIAQRDAISSQPPQVKPVCGKPFYAALDCCLTPDSCSSGGLLGGFGGQSINDAAKNMAANGTMLAQAATSAATVCADLRKTCYEACQAELKTINPSTEYVLYQGHQKAIRYCEGVFREAESCLMAVVAQASSVVSQASSVATQTAAATALTGASALGGSGTGGSGSASGDSGFSNTSGVGVNGQQVALEGCQPDVYKPGCPARTGYEKPGRPVASASTGGSSTNLGGGSSSSIGGQQVALEGCQPDVYKPGCPARTGYEKPGRPVASATTGSRGSAALAAAPTTGGGGGRSPGSSGGGMALTANPGGGGTGGSGSSQLGSSGSSVASSGGGANGSTGTGAGGGWGSNPRNGSPYGQGLGASPTAAGTTGSGVAASTTLASAGTNQGLPDNNCDLEEKVFTPACFDIMNDYCTTTQRQGSGCKSFCRTNSASTACAGSK